MAASDIAVERNRADCPCAKLGGNIKTARQIARAGFRAKGKALYQRNLHAGGGKGSYYFTTQRCIVADRVHEVLRQPVGRSVQTKRDMAATEFASEANVQRRVQAEHAQAFNAQRVHASGAEIGEAALAV